MKNYVIQGAIDISSPDSVAEDHVQDGTSSFVPPFSGSLDITVHF